MILLVFFIIMMILICKTLKIKGDEYFLAILCSFVISIVLVLITWGVLNIMYPQQWGESLPSPPTKIYSVVLNDNLHGELHGSFMLGSGFIDTSKVYYYFIKFNNGDLQLQHMNSDNVRIRETNAVEPQIISYTKYPIQRKWYQIVFYPSNDYSYAIPDYSVLIVPANTIVREYSIKP